MTPEHIACLIGLCFGIPAGVALGLLWTRHE